MNILPQNSVLLDNFAEAKRLRELIYSKEADSMDSKDLQFTVAVLNGMEKAFCIMGVIQDYFQFLKS